MNRALRLAAAAIALGAIASACDDTSSEPPSSAVLTAPDTSTAPAPVTSTPESPAETTVETAPPPTASPSTTAAPRVPPQLADRELATIAVDGEELLVALADTGGARRQGLMAVTDLLDLDGMLFVWSADTGGSFWMRNTVIPLDIAFFAANGSLVNTFPMEPCDLGTDCPIYESGGEYRYALETDQGRLTLNSESELSIPLGLNDGG
jgi:uncharacterized membrane protein (UPF0127 family)